MPEPIHVTTTGPGGQPSSRTTPEVDGVWEATVQGGGRIPVSAWAHSEREALCRLVERLFEVSASAEKFFGITDRGY